MSKTLQKQSTMKSYHGCENCKNFFTSKFLKEPCCKVFGGVNEKLLQFIGIRSADECKFYERKDK